jgi:HAD superfamily hydrolase (TIGR01509 family)
VFKVEWVPMKDIDAVIFDMDGVIVDTEPLHAESEQMTCREFGFDIPSSEWEQFKGIRLVEIFGGIIRANNSNVDPERMAVRAREMFLELLGSKVPIVPGSVDFIRQVRERGSKIALTTSTHASVQRKIFELLDLAPLFDVITTGDEITHGKPNPEPYAKTVVKLGLDPARCAVIEDSDNGIRSAKAAGCVAIGITTTFPRSVLFDCGADSVADNFGEISKIFNP